MNWVIELYQSLDRDGPAGYPVTSSIYRDCETNGSSETAEDLERRALRIALDDMRFMQPELHHKLLCWHGVSGDPAMDEVWEWLADRVDQRIG